MSTLHMRPLALVLASAAIAVAGCGGSSNKSGGTGTGAPASTTGGTGTSATSGSLPLSTKVNSAAYRAYAQQGLAQIPGVTSTSIPKIINCVVQKQLSQGITTLAAVKTHKSEVSADGRSCARAAGLH
jgi:hypothetical protein